MSDEELPADEMDGIVRQLEEAGLVETYVRPDGKTWYRLTKKGAQVGRSLAMDGADGEAVLDALLDAVQDA